MFVKICGLSREEHVQAAVTAGADAVGFVFAESARRVSPSHARAITNNVPGTVRKVAVMLHPTNEEWQAVLAGFMPDVLQTDAEDFASLDVPDSVERWSVYREGSKATENLGLDKKVSVTYLYEGPKSGRGETVDWTHAAEIATQGKMILAGGISAANVAKAIATVKPFGVDVSSAVESAPGQKDSTLIREFIDAARAAEKCI
jgi:phosphoribosylanthranilate isomerase